MQGEEKKVGSGKHLRHLSAMALVALDSARGFGRLWITAVLGGQPQFIALKGFSYFF